MNMRLNHTPRKRISTRLVFLFGGLVLIAACGGTGSTDPTGASDDAGQLTAQAVIVAALRTTPDSQPASATEPPPTPTATLTRTPTPNLASTATSEAHAVATAVAATLTAQPTATPNLAATATGQAQIMATSVAATLTAQPTPTPNYLATQVWEANRMSTAVAATLTAIAPAPSITSAENFAACLDACVRDRSNARRTFPEGISKIYITYDYTNFPPGARYQRIWRVAGRGEWVRYDCNWDGPENGVTEVTLTEPNGLYSGAWELLIVVNGATVLDEQFFVEGDHTYWYPAGVFDTCFGKRSTQ